MGEQRFDVFTRQAARAISRRGSLAALGAAGAGLVALVDPQLAADARRGKKKRGKRKKDPNKKCKKQVKPCKEVMRDYCEDEELSPEDCQERLECCESLGTCDVVAALLCLATASSSDN